MANSDKRVKWACIAISILSILISIIFLNDIDKPISQPIVSEPESVIDQQFSKFCAQFDKNYVDQGEYEMRKGIFAKSLKKIEDYNKNDNDKNGDGVPDIVLKVNWMADLTEQEKYGQVNDLDEMYERNAEYIKSLNQEAELFTERGIEGIQDHTDSKHPLVFAKKLPESIDWRDYEAVSPVIRQGRCGSCWAFASAGVLESALALKTNTTAIHLSAQQIVDCVKSGKWRWRVSRGCRGGLGSEVFQYFKKNYIKETSKYPYKAVEQECMTEPALEKLDYQKINVKRKDNKPALPLVRVQNFYTIQPGNVDALKRALIIGPVYMSLNSNSVPFQYYHSGIIDSKECTDKKVTHAVLAVGYGVEKSKRKDVKPVEYVIIKNSYGKGWGEQGFARISLDKTNHKKFGVCSILRYNLIAQVDLKAQKQIE